MLEDEGVWEDFEPGAGPSEWEGTDLPEWHEDPPEDSGSDDLADLDWKIEEGKRRAKREAERKQGALSGLYGPVAQVAARAELDTLGKLSPDATARKLHGAGQLLEELSPEHRESGYLYLHAQATKALRSAWGDWRAVGEFVRNHLPEPLGDRSPYKPEGGLRAVDVRTLDMDVPALVEDYIPAGQVGLLVGDNGLGKSFAMAALGGGVGYGRDWLGQRIPEPGHALFILSEARREFPKRLAAWLHSEGILPDTFTREELRETLDGHVSIVDGKVLLTDPRLEENLVAEIEARGTRLVVCDILNKLLGDGHHEDNSETAAAVTMLLSDVAERTGATCILVHHPGHSASRARGSHAWKDNVDFEYVVRGDNDHFARGGTARLLNTKMKEDRRTAPLGYRLQVVDVECDGVTWNKAVVREAAALAADAFTVEERIREAVKINPGMNKSDLLDHLGGNRNDVSEEVTALMEAGKLRNGNEGKPGPWSLYLAGEWEGDPDADLSLADVPGEVDDSAATEA